MMSSSEEVRTPLRHLVLAVGSWSYTVVAKSSTMLAEITFTAMTEAGRIETG